MLLQCSNARLSAAFFALSGAKMPTQPVTPTKGNDFSDIELVDRLLRGAPGAFDLFYRRHERLIYHCIRTRADAADVADLFQSFFERLVERDYHVLKLGNEERRCQSTSPRSLETSSSTFTARSAGENNP